MMKEHFSAGSFGVGVVAGAVLAFMWFFGTNTIPPTPPSSSGSGSISSVSTSTPQSSAVSVADQPAGTSVTVESVTVPPPGVWVAVREVNGTELGNVLGAVLETGPRSNVSVPLLRATEPGRRYAVELYRNDGSGAFDLGTLSVYVDFDTSEPVIVYFSTFE